MTDLFPKDLPISARGVPCGPEGLQLPLTGSGELRDSPAGCRAQAEADLDRLDTPACEEDRCRCALSAAAWLSRAERLERQEAQPGPNAGEPTMAGRSDAAP